MSTIIIDDPAVETALERAAAKAGVPLQNFVRDVLAERFVAPVQTRETTQQFFNRIAKHGPVIDVSREGIYADF